MVGKNCAWLMQRRRLVQKFLNVQGNVAVFLPAVMTPFQLPLHLEHSDFKVLSSSLLHSISTPDYVHWARVCHAINCCLHLCPLAFLLLLFRRSMLLWTCCGNSFSTSDFIHFLSASLLLWARVFVMLSITAYTFVLLSFFCCCLESLCCSGPAVAIASSCSCSIGVVLLLGDDPCC